jgi:predicted nucleic acid-binding protein
VTFVVDASMAAAWMLPDERNDNTDEVLLRLIREPGRAPSLFWHEARSLFLKAERRGRFPAGGASAFMQRLWRLPIEDAGAGADATVFALAGAHGLSSYDATYLALALAEQRPIATLDKKLADAAKAEGIGVLGPLRST